VGFSTRYLSSSVGYLEIDVTDCLGDTTSCASFQHDQADYSILPITGTDDRAYAPGRGWHPTPTELVNRPFPSFLDFTTDLRGGRFPSTFHDFLQSLVDVTNFTSFNASLCPERRCLSLILHTTTYPQSNIQPRRLLVYPSSSGSHAFPSLLLWAFCLSWLSVFSFLFPDVNPYVHRRFLHGPIGPPRARTFSFELMLPSISFAS